MIGSRWILGQALRQPTLPSWRPACEPPPGHLWLLEAFPLGEMLGQTLATPPQPRQLSELVRWAQLNLMLFADFPRLRDGMTVAVFRVPVPLHAKLPTSCLLKASVYVCVCGGGEGWQQGYRASQSSPCLQPEEHG